MITSLPQFSFSPGIVKVSETKWQNTKTIGIHGFSCSVLQTRFENIQRKRLTPVHSRQNGYSLLSWKQDPVHLGHWRNLPIKQFASLLVVQVKVHLDVFVESWRPFNWGLYITNTSSLSLQPSTLSASSLLSLLDVPMYASLSWSLWQVLTSGDCSLYASSYWSFW